MLFFYPLAYLLYKGHYAFAGRQIVKLLDDAATNVFDTYNRSNCRILLVQAVVLLLLLTTYAFFHSEIFQMTLAGSSSLPSKCLKILTTFSVYVDMFFTFGIVFLFKLIMRQRLYQMVKQINCQFSESFKNSDQGLTT